MSYFISKNLRPQNWVNSNPRYGLRYVFSLQILDQKKVLLLLKNNMHTWSKIYEKGVKYFISGFLEILYTIQSANTLDWKSWHIGYYVKVV